MKAKTFCNQFLKILGGTHSEISFLGDLESFLDKHYEQRALIQRFLNAVVKGKDVNKILIPYFQKKPLVNSLKEILNPTGFVPELMHIVSLFKLIKRGEDFVRPNVPYSEVAPHWRLIDGSITNWKVYSGREKMARLLSDPEIGKVRIEFVSKKGKEVKDYKNVCYSQSSLQRALALRLARESKPEKASPMDAYIIKCWWTRDKNTNKKGLYEVLSKLSKSFKDARIERQRFIFQMMRRLKGPFEKRLEQTTREVNEKFPRKELYSVETIKSEYSRAKKWLCSKKA